MTSVVVAAPSTLAADVGAGVADAGGSVVDVAIGATLTAMCTEPGVCAPGGGGFLTIWPAGEDPLSIDGYMTMPGKDLDADRPLLSRQVTMEYGGGITTEVGPASIAVPGGFAALDSAHRRWGRLPWAEVIGAVADALVDGFPLPAACRYYLGFSGESVFGLDPVSRSALHDGDRLLDTGESIVVDGLVDTLRHIAEVGAQSFYRGDLAKSIADDLADRGSRLTRLDLAGYQALTRSPATSRLGEWTVATTPPPAVGGVTLSAILRLIFQATDPLDPMAWIGAQVEVLGNHRRQLDSAADREAAGWDLLGRIPDDPVSAGSTVSIAAAGSDGTVCAATMSGGYGSGVIPTGTGLWMNNSLGEVELNPGGLEATPVGARLISNMAPTALEGPGRRLAIGSPGADRITSALAVTLTLLMAGEDLTTAVEHPRAHYERRTRRVSAEPNLNLSELSLGLVEFPARDMYFGGVTAVESSRGVVGGHADSRRTGGVATGGSRK
jgi:gamma-glutamyltranspeptidase/glutathione hydrolase